MIVDTAVCKRFEESWGVTFYAQADMPAEELRLRLEADDRCWSASCEFVKAEKSASANVDHFGLRIWTEKVSGRGT